MAIPTSIISLTAAGQDLAQRVRKHLPDAETLHKPRPFAETVQSRFSEGQRLILICAVGIAVRTLAPVLRDKFTDPAVLVMDEAGEFVIPLISGHEGGANAWGDWLAGQMNARCVITGKADYRRPVYVMGIGCDRGCPQQTIADLVETTLAGMHLDPDPVTGDIFVSISSIALKSDETGLLAYAQARGLPLCFFPANRLLEYTDRLSYQSEIVFRETGCYGVAEAAALANAEEITGNRAELLISKQKNARATFSVARAFRQPPT